MSFFQPSIRLLTLLHVLVFQTIATSRIFPVERPEKLQFVFHGDENANKLKNVGLYLYSIYGYQTR